MAKRSKDWLEALLMQDIASILDPNLDVLNFVGHYEFAFFSPKYFLRTQVIFCGELILIWTSGDIYPGFQTSDGNSLSLVNAQN